MRKPTISKGYSYRKLLRQQNYDECSSPVTIVPRYFTPQRRTPPRPRLQFAETLSAQAAPRQAQRSAPINTPANEQTVVAQSDALRSNRARGTHNRRRPFAPRRTRHPPGPPSHQKTRTAPVNPAVRHAMWNLTASRPTIDPQTIERRMRYPDGRRTREPLLHPTAPYPRRRKPRLPTTKTTDRASRLRLVDPSRGPNPQHPQSAPKPSQSTIFVDFRS